MTKKSTKAEVNSFVKGLITEASPLNFPGNAMAEGVNFTLNRDGTLQRRLGFDLDSTGQLVPITSGVTASDLQTTPPVPFKWMNVGGDGSISLLVTQVGSDLYIFNLNQSSPSIGGAIEIIDMTTIGFVSGVQYSFTSVDGKLVIVSGADTVGVVSYNAGVFTLASKTLLVRDVWGVEVTSELAYETDDKYRGGIPDDHRYNLYNQSWGIPRKSAANVLVDPTTEYNTTLSVYPSNSETVWLGLAYQAVVGGDPYERMYPNLFTDVFGSSPKAAKGYFIIDILKRGTSRSAAIAANYAKHPVLTMASFTTNADYTDGGATVVSEFAGRVFYGGFSGATLSGDSRSPTLSNYVLFSQLVRSANDINKCHQESDPTAREGGDLLDTDGGFIRITGADTIVGMRNIGNSLIVFATNGVWSITGGSDFGFTATNYRVDKITSFGCLSNTAIVDDGNQALYWSEDGIYNLTKDQVGTLKASNITEMTIQTLYEAIPTASKHNAIGVFDSAGKKIRWVYYTGSYFASDYEAYELILDTVLGAFYQYKIGNLTPNTTAIIGPFSAIPFIESFVPTFVIAGTDSVIAGVDTVVIDYPIQSSNVLNTRYLCLHYNGVTLSFAFGYYNNPRFKDWESVDTIGVDASGYFTTGDVTAGDSSVVKQTPYLILNFRRTETELDLTYLPINPSGCLVRVQWDYANSINSNKWSSNFQGYRFNKPYFTNDNLIPYDTGFALVTTRNKLRGRGRAFALHMQTEASKDCQIIGWSIALNGNSVV